MIKTFDFKLPKQRKARTWVVYPSESNSKVVVQSDGVIGEFDPTTGKGKLNPKGEYFFHLSFAKPFEFPNDFVQLALKAQKEQSNGKASVVSLLSE